LAGLFGVNGVDALLILKPVPMASAENLRKMLGLAVSQQERLWALYPIAFSYGKVGWQDFGVFIP
jgi:hypothetical protein